MERLRVFGLVVLVLGLLSVIVCMLMRGYKCDKCPCLCPCLLCSGGVVAIVLGIILMVATPHLRDCDESKKQSYESEHMGDYVICHNLGGLSPYGPLASSRISMNFNQNPARGKGVFRGSVPIDVRVEMVKGHQSGNISLNGGKEYVPLQWKAGAGLFQINNDKYNFCSYQAWMNQNGVKGCQPDPR